MVGKTQALEKNGRKLDFGFRLLVCYGEVRRAASALQAAYFRAFTKSATALASSPSTPEMPFL